MEYIVNKLNKSGICLEKVYIEDKEFFITVHEDRVFFIKNMNETGPESLIDDSVFIADYISTGQFDEKIKKNLSLKDKEKIFNKLNLISILWDLYIVGIHFLDNTNENYNQEQISRIERDKFVARKIVVEDTNKESIVNNLIDIFQPSKRLEEIITGNEKLSMKGVFENILKIDNSNSIKIENVNSLIDLGKYLDEIKLTVEEIDKKIDGGEYFEN
ncbi:ABC-three component system middle component 1 [Clostridium drakei]|uniref:Uncharacterized protein n=1 Tax=Clostridium drakei TaxID=332101 RepID=A0A2U8DUJ3_9CLOT|nr:ABC-three component system middle component 1 [Clostridium drakei]AWI06338.1 hypothetical protein B9W14_18145 [Clostridium drakei]